MAASPQTALSLRMIHLKNLLLLFILERGIRGQREGKRENLKQASPDVGLILTTLRS